MDSAAFKVGDMFFHREQKVIVEIAKVVIPDTKFRKPNLDNEYCYDLHILNSTTGLKSYWKRYWEEKVIDVLEKIDNNGATVLFKDNK